MTSHDTGMLTVRSAVEEDSMLLYGWRNSPDVRKWAFKQEPISLETHRRWFKDALVNGHMHVLIAELDGSPVGVVRMDETEDGAEVHVYLGPEHFGKGLGARVISEACAWARRSLGIGKFFAKIMPENKASVRAFEKAGFKSKYLVMELAEDD